MGAIMGAAVGIAADAAETGGIGIQGGSGSAPAGLPVEEVRRLMDACWKAKTVTELMPALPRGLKPRYIHVIDAVWHLNASAGQAVGTARVGDVSAFLGVTTPSVTKLVGEMARLGLVVKHDDAADRRVVTLTLTERGLDLHRTYVEEYHAHLSRLLGGLPAGECETTVRTLTEVLRLMQRDNADAAAQRMNGGERNHHE